MDMVTMDAIVFVALLITGWRMSSNAGQVKVKVYFKAHRTQSEVVMPMTDTPQQTVETLTTVPTCTGP